MPYYHADPRRESEPTALPNIEIFEAAAFYHECPDCDADHCLPQEHNECPDCGRTMTTVESPDHGRSWWYWFCFPGCTPDSDLAGPFDSAAEALADARIGYDD